MGFPPTCEALPKPSKEAGLVCRFARLRMCFAYVTLHAPTLIKKIKQDGCIPMTSPAGQFFFVRKRTPPDKNQIIIKQLPQMFEYMRSKYHPAGCMESQNLLKNFCRCRIDKHAKADNTKIEEPKYFDQLLRLPN